jgi:hypothetical protein
MNRKCLEFHGLSWKEQDLLEHFDIVSGVSSLGMIHFWIERKFTEFQ